MIFDYQRTSGELIDVLDRVLDKGILMDASTRVALIGVDLASLRARIVVASCEIYLERAEALGVTGRGETHLALAHSASSDGAAGGHPPRTRPKQRIA